MSSETCRNEFPHALCRKPHPTRAEQGPTRYRLLPTIEAGVGIDGTRKACLPAPGRKRPPLPLFSHSCTSLPMRSASWRFIVSAALAFAALLTLGTETQLMSLPLIKQGDIIEAWFAGRAEFGSEEMKTGGTPFRTARWNTLKPGTCSMKDAEVTITGEGQCQLLCQSQIKRRWG